MTEISTKPRQEFKNIGLGQILFAYRVPLAGLTSILHRVSGVLLFVSLPFLLWRDMTMSTTFENWFEVRTFHEC
jgi:succinate dehydrogenase / fumarate reductase, cytochrome b subunit